MLNNREGFRVLFPKARKYFRGIFPYYKERGVDSGHVSEWVRLEIENELEMTLKKLQIELRTFLQIEQPFSGVSFISLGSTFKYLRYQKFLDSRQRLTLKLGERTKTNEYSSPVIECNSFEHVSKADIEQFCSKWVGSVFQQMPEPIRPARPLITYHEDPNDPIRALRKPPFPYKEERLAREIKIDQIQLIDFKPPLVSFDIIGSPEFLARSFAESFAKELNTFAHVVDYERMSIGPFSISDCLRKHQLYSKEIKESMVKHTPTYINAVNPHLDKLILYKDRRLFSF